MAKFLSGRQSNFNIGIKSYTESKTVLQTIGKVGIGTTNAGNYSLYVVGDTNITGVVSATTFIGAVTGIAASATQLVTPRTFQITGDVVASPVSFDGTGNVSLAATIQPNSVGLGTDTTGDYVRDITGTANQISVSATSGEGSTPILSIPSQFTAPQDVTVTRDLLVSRNLNVDGNITIGGTSATLFTTELKISDPDIVLGFRTDGSGNDVSNDNTANHGGVALASTEGTPLVDLFIAGIETNPATYKKIMWFKSGTFAGLGTDAWLINYAVGIGSTQFPTGTRLAAGSVQFTENDLAVVRNINSSGIVTATTFVGAFTGTATSTTNIPNLTGAITSNNTTTSLGSFSSSDLATALTDETGSGSAVFATSPTLVTPVLGAANATSIVVSSGSTFTNGPILVGTGTSTGTASQRLQVTGGAYVSGSVGIGTTNPQAKLHVVGDVILDKISFTSSGIITSSNPGVGTVVYYGDGSNLQGVNAFNVINQDIISSPVFPTFASNTGVSSVGISTTKLVFVPASGNLGLGTTNPTSKLHVVGDGLFTGVVTATTFLGNINFGSTGSISIANTTGTSGQYLQSTGIGVTWATFPTLRTTQTNTATAGQTSFGFSYNVNFLDVYVNGVKLTSSEYIASNGSSITLISPAFVNDIVEFISYNITSVGGGGGGGGASIIDDLSDVNLTLPPAAGENLTYDGYYWVNDYVVTATTSTTSQTTLHSLSSSSYRSVEYMIQATQGTNYHVTKILAIHDGTTTYPTEYGTLYTNGSLGTFDVDISGGNIRLRVTPSSSSSTSYKIKFTAIKV